MIPKLKKFYVESGPGFMITVLATDEMDAMSRAFAMRQNGPPLKLADVVICNERGYVFHREGHELNGDEFILPTKLVLGIEE